MRIIDQLKKTYENDPWLECNHCGTRFKGGHDCDYDELKQINARYKQALEFYADENKYFYTSRSLKGHPKIIRDEGSTARQALEGESE